jgi:hypothetical protein
MDEMINHISTEVKLKKSRTVANALALDFTALTKSKAIALESESKRRDPSALPSQFIRTTIFKVAWYKFLSKKEAENFNKLLKSTIHNRHDRNKTVVEIIHDFGILELMKELRERGSNFENTKRVYATLSKSIKFGL